MIRKIVIVSRYFDRPRAYPRGSPIIAAEEADLEAALEDYTWVPVISLGVSYRF